MLKDILSSDSFNGVLSESVKADIESAFNEAVELKATEIAAEEISAKEISLTEQFMEAKQELFESVANKMDEFLHEQLSDAAGLISNKLDGKINEARVSLLTSIFEAQCNATGKDLKKVVEGDEKDCEGDSLKDKYDATKKELDEVKKKLKEFETEKKIDEAAAGLSIVEAEKFKAIARLTNLDEDCEKKLEAIKKSVAKNENDSEADSEDTETKKELKESFFGIQSKREVAAKTLDFSNF